MTQRTASHDPTWTRIATAPRRPRHSSLAPAKVPLAFLATRLLLADAAAATRAPSRRLDRVDPAVDSDDTAQRAHDAQHASGALDVELEPADTRPVVHAVGAAAGRGYLLDGNLPNLPGGRTYRLRAPVDAERTR